MFELLSLMCSKILIDGRDPNAVDNEGCALPTLVYLAREKRPWHFHNFKAGAMNALVINAIDNPSIFSELMHI